MNTYTEFGSAQMTNEELESIPRIGWLVFYQIGEVDVPFERARELFKEKGFNPSDLPETTKKKAYSLALDDIRDMNYWADVRTFARPIGETKHGVAHQISLEKVNREEERLDYEMQLKTVFDKNTEAIDYQFSSGDPDQQAHFKMRINDAFCRYVERICKHNIFEFMRWQLKEWDSKAVKSRGGCWFVPDTKTEQIRRTEELLTALNSTLYRTPIIDTPEWREAVADMAEDEFETELKAMERDLEKLVAEAQAGATIKASVIQTRLDRFEDVRKRALAYEKLLSFKATDIRDYVNKLKGVATNILAEKYKGLQEVAA